MAKPFVLQALNIFGFEEMLKLSQSAQVKTVLMKKAAGAELIFWDDAPDVDHVPKARADADVLPFKKSGPPSDLVPPLDDPNDSGKPSEESGNFHSSEFMLWQRELSKDTQGPSKKDAVKGYSRATEMYIVKTPNLEGKDKIRFASTNGVLVNKKQA